MFKCIVLQFNPNLKFGIYKRIKTRLKIVRIGIVEKPEDYMYSSARNYVGLESKIEIIKADFLWKTV